MLSGVTELKDIIYNNPEFNNIEEDVLIDVLKWIAIENKENALNSEAQKIKTNRDSVNNEFKSGNVIISGCCTI
mgnify:CR=1 FL=1